jgi:mannose-6-phosphate isomerase-like protein (cupin superfamily)
MANTKLQQVHRLYIAAVILGLFGGGLSRPAAAQGQDPQVKTNPLLRFEKSGAGNTAVDEISLDAGGRLPLQGYLEERLYYALDGRGIISIYEGFPQGDVYELRQDLAIYMTPQINHEIFNTGNAPLRLVVFRVKGGTAPEGELSWSAVSQRGVAVDKPAAGSGVAVTRVLDEGSNPSKEEGLHLRIHDIWLRRPQKFSNAEVLTVAPGRSTRPHTHHDSDETLYVLVGEGSFVWNDKKIPFKAGGCVSYPVGVIRRVENTGGYPLSYICISTFTK